VYLCHFDINCSSQTDILQILFECYSSSLRLIFCFAPAYITLNSFSEHAWQYYNYAIGQISVINVGRLVRHGRHYLNIPSVAQALMFPTSTVITVCHDFLFWNYGNNS